MPLSRLKQAKETFVKICEMNESAHSIALGAAIGIWVGFLPCMGIQMSIAVPIAFLLRANKLLAAAGVWFTNPLTFIPIYYWCYWTGTWVYPVQPVTLDQFRQLANDFTIDRVLFLGEQIVVPLIAGCLILGFFFGGITYFVVKEWVNRIRARRARTVASETAKADSEAAKADSEAAKADSEAAKADSETAETDSETAETDSETAETDSETAETDSETAEADKDASKQSDRVEQVDGGNRAEPSVRMPHVPFFPDRSTPFSSLFLAFDELQEQPPEPATINDRYPKGALRERAYELLFQKYPKKLAYGIQYLECLVGHLSTVEDFDRWLELAEYCQSLPGDQLLHERLSSIVERVRLDRQDTIDECVEGSTGLADDGALERDELFARFEELRESHEPKGALHVDRDREYWQLYLRVLAVLIAEERWTRALELLDEYECKRMAHALNPVPDYRTQEQIIGYLANKDLTVARSKVDKWIHNSTVPCISDIIKHSTLFSGLFTSCPSQPTSCPSQPTSCPSQPRHS